MDIRKTTERSVDSLQRIYAFMIALALGEAIRRAVLEKGTAAILPLAEFWGHLPALIVFVITLVPFYHGMNRHLDATYLGDPDKKLRGPLLFDFFFFVIEAGAFFALAALITSGAVFFKLFAAVFIADALWGIVTYFISDGTGWKWFVLNGIAGVLTALFCFQVVVEPSVNPWAICVIAILRTLLDYGWCWRFYFPITPADAQTSSATSLPAS